MHRLALVCLIALVAVPAFAQTEPRTNPTGQPPNAPVQRIGGAGETERVVGHVAVGEHAPVFDVLTATGAHFRLKDSRGHWVALFFTDRREELSDIARHAVRLDSLKFTTYVLCHEKPQTLAGWHDPNSAKLIALADDRGEIASTYGVWDNEGSRTRPGLVLLDPQGVVKVALLGQRVGAPSLLGLVQTAVGGF